MQKKKLNVKGIQMLNMVFIHNFFSVLGTFLEFAALNGI